MLNKRSLYSAQRFLFWFLCLILAVGYSFYRFFDIYFSQLSTRTCTVLRLTGYQCWSCGGTRAADRLLRFQFQEAFRYNPFMTLFLIICLIILLQYAVCFLINRPVYRPTLRMGVSLAIVITILLVAFTIWRNSSLYPAYFLQ